MGGIADYSGATVLELPLAHGVYVAAQQSEDGRLVVCTAGPATPPLAHATTSIPVAVLSDGPAEEAPERLRATLLEIDAAWAAYVLGPLAMLYAAGLLSPQRDAAPAGLRLAIWSDVPAGAGVSSSAALEVASLRALQGLFALDLPPLRLAALAQQAEHRAALAPCGIMDQATAVLGRQDHLLMLRCQPAEELGQRRLPRDVQVFGINSGVAHRVGGGQYGRVRAATFMGRAIIAAQGAGDPPGGYLCNLTPERFAARYEGLLPVELRGAEFLAQYGATGDDATRVEPATIYPVRACTTHPVQEQANVLAFLEALDRYEADGGPAALVEAGAAMFRSHHSYGARCGLGTSETDLIVELVRAYGPARGVYGAKITGGGAGGTVAVLGAGPQAATAVEETAAEYARRSGNAVGVIQGSSPGAVATPLETVHLGPAGEGGAHGG
jgi:L-arabinokinase